MATAKELLTIKGAHVLSIGPEATVMTAATLMNEHRVGSLVVLEQGRLVGMFTERDVLRRVVGERRDPTETLVRDVMTVEVAICRPHTLIDEARTAMRNRRIRHLPVLDDDGNLVGLISIGDLNAYLANEQEQTIFLMQEYLYGRT